MAKSKFKKRNTIIFILIATALVTGAVLTIIG